jgi:hypothetical protein
VVENTTFLQGFRQIDPIPRRRGNSTISDDNLTKGRQKEGYSKKLQKKGVEHQLFRERLCRKPSRKKEEKKEEKRRKTKTSTRVNLV